MADFLPGGTEWDGGEWRAMLRCTTPPAVGVVIFDFNPEQIVFDRHAELKSYGTASPGTGTPPGSTGSVFKKVTPGSIKLSNLVFWGADTKPKCDQLTNWMNPGGGWLSSVAVGASSALAKSTLGSFKNPATRLARMELATKLPLLTFNFGPPVAGFWYDCYLQSLQVTYTRFTEMPPIPIMAKVNLTLQVQPSLLGMLPTNPTSGGLPGRSRHVVTEGDNLQSIATGTYGSPGRWRAVAEANGIDDPLRTRPGDVVYLPNPSELSGDRRR